MHGELGLAIEFARHELSFDSLIISKDQGPLTMSLTILKGSLVHEPSIAQEIKIRVVKRLRLLHEFRVTVLEVALAMVLVILPLTFVDRKLWFVFGLEEKFSLTMTLFLVIEVSKVEGAILVVHSVWILIFRLWLFTGLFLNFTLLVRDSFEDL